MDSPPRVNILGVGISAINLQEATARIVAWIAQGSRHYVNVCTVHTIMECQQSERLRAIVNRSGLSTPDGMPLVWISRAHGYRQVGRVYGPDLMLALCDRGQSLGMRHFFYGGRPGVADLMVQRLQRRFPKLISVGTHAPPRQALDHEETDTVIDTINTARPDVVWVGLGTPKQDYWIARHRPRLHAPALIAVGAAFDFHAGLLRQAPRWIQKTGMEWLFRLIQEPKRLGYRYLVYNPLFITGVLLQSTRLRNYRLESDD